MTYAFGSHKRLLAVDVPHLLVAYILLLTHRTDIVHTERQHIAVSYGIHYSIYGSLLPKAWSVVFKSNLPPVDELFGNIGVPVNPNR